MSADDRDGAELGTVTTLRVDRPDGTTMEIVREDCGRVTTTRIGPEGSVVAQFVAEIRPDGAVIVIDQVAATADPLSPGSVESQTNPFGTMVERLEFDGDLVVENTFDDDVALRSVKMGGPWGEQTMELRPDGSRSLQWRTELHHGAQGWDAAGRLNHYELESCDGTRYRWDLIDGGARKVVVRWDGSRETTVHDPEETAR